MKRAVKALQNFGKSLYGPVLILPIVGLFIAFGNVFGNGNLAGYIPLLNHPLIQDFGQLVSKSAVEILANLALVFAAAASYRETGILPDAFHVGVHGAFIVDVACSLAFDLRQRHLVIVENKGAIANLPYDAMVEVPAYITAQGPEPVRMGNVPRFHRALLEQQLASEQLLVEAAIEGNYEKALQAFTLNRTVPTLQHAKAILDEMIAANREYWPQLKQAYSDGVAQ